MKKALLIGCNYPGTTAELRGCHNDVAHMKEYLEKHNYECTIMTDVPEAPAELRPTRHNIIKQMTNIVLSGATDVFIHYSGHGSYVSDTSGDEKDGRDECLVPCDYAYYGLITDDQIRAILLLAPKSLRVSCLLDCCHSGTGMDLGWNVYRKMRGDYVLLRDSRYNDTPCHVVMLSGCQDEQYSADAWEEGKFQGAMTWAFLKVAEEGAAKHGHTIVPCDYAINCIRKCLRKNGYKQYPNLSSGRSFSLATPFHY